VRRSEALIAEDDSQPRHRAAPRGHRRASGRALDYQVEYELGLNEWRDVYIDYRQLKALQLKAGIFKCPSASRKTPARRSSTSSIARASARDWRQDAIVA
jgi:hypothetical protein